MSDLDSIAAQVNAQLEDQWSEIKAKTEELTELMESVSLEAPQGGMPLADAYDLIINGFRKLIRERDHFRQKVEKT